MLLDRLEKKGLISPPSFVVSNSMYLTIMGSHAYGVADTNVKDKPPDYDVYGFCIPPKDYIFPHLRGDVAGFGTPGTNFEQWQKHNIFDQDAHGGNGQEWDLQVFNIVKYFELCRENNPNMIDSLFTPENCVTHCTQVGRMVRDNRKLFLSKQAWKKFRGYAWSQMHKMESKETVAEAMAMREWEKELGVPHETTLDDVRRQAETRKRRLDVCGEKLYAEKRDIMPKLNPLGHLTDESLTKYLNWFERMVEQSTRFQMIKKHGYDVKFGYHVLRLLDEAEQILLTGEIDLQRSREAMKSVRRGEWKVQDIRAWAMDKEKALEAAYVECKLPEKAPEAKLKELLLNCLEEHYGNLSDAVQVGDWSLKALKDIDAILQQVRPRIHGAKDDKPRRRFFTPWF